jgi:hypothetical protein
MGVVVRVEGKRGCGWRQAGGLYMMGGELMSPCGVLPIALTVCPFCNAGIKLSRGWTWVLKEVLGTLECSWVQLPEKRCNELCVPFDGSVEEFGLLWVGEKFYATPDDFMREGAAQGISKRISAVPRNFVLGETWVLLAHRRAVLRLGSEGSVEGFAGVFSAFRPTALEYVVKRGDSPEKITGLEDRGITCVEIRRDVEEQNLEL